jgi:putative DNA primase/helicase
MLKTDDDSQRILDQILPGKQSMAYKYTDSGNAERFADALQGKYLYVPEQKTWYRYTGKHWAEDVESSIVQDAINCLRQAQKAALSIVDDEIRSREIRWLLSSESHSKLTAALNLLSSFPSMVARINQFDADDMLLNVQNGTIDLRSGILRPHDRNDYITKICNVDYIPDAESQLFNSFIDEITESNADKIKYLQKLLGYCCTGKTSEEEFFQAKGSGSNGKTKLFETVKYCLGSYAITASPDILMQKDLSGIPNDIARLQGARMVLTSEPDPGKKFSDNAIKSLTGGDTLTARFLHREFFEFTMKAKIIMLTNHEIRAIGTDHGLWRRMTVIPFSYTVPEEKRDKNLQEKLYADAQAVLTWMVQGCLIWQKEGLEQPKELKQAKSEYRHAQDAVGLFLEDNCIEDPKTKISATELYRAYTRWCSETGEYEISQRLFGSRLREKGYTSVKSGTVYWFGIRLLDNLDNLDKNPINTKNKNIYRENTESCPVRPVCPESENDLRRGSI